jgi:uroporphyrin-III C-methyltransferase/precorrin-2 dehydrogenase/sirohydrochlorin ferrochelatase
MKTVSRQPSEIEPARIGALSVLPVFLDLAGKRAVVAGGSDAAAWKAELLAAAGAEVHVHAPSGTLSCGMATLAESKSTVFHQPGEWTVACLAGAAVAVADARDDSEAEAFENAARAAGVPCNVIDRPVFCHFQFGSVVNRSPVVVGISTSGAAPILGQAVRRRIEALLPAALASWAVLAGRLRGRVIDRLSPGAQRRDFWERFVDRAFGSAPDASSEAVLDDVMAAAAHVKGHGHVTFVGAGPGEAELLTLKAVRALQYADVILFDDLVSGDVLELARREARRIPVGRRTGRPGCTQHAVDAMMISFARAGRRVVRLKPGDPLIFGRTVEEIAQLERAGIGYDVVPGITVGIARAVGTNQDGSGSRSTTWFGSESEKPYQAVACGVPIGVDLSLD